MSNTPVAETPDYPISRKTSSVAGVMQRNSTLFFWLFNTGGWLGFAVVSFVSLNLWYNQPEVEYVAHNILQSFLGMLVCWPMRGIYRALWQTQLVLRLVLTVVVVLLLSLIWAALRLVLFLVLTDETGLWADFGGWYFPSIFIFFCWTALYYGVKFYQLFEEEHQRLVRVESEQRESALALLRAESQARDAQLKMLRYQINPHFLFNTLNAVNSLIAAQHPAQASEMVLHLSRFLRYSLENDLAQQVPLKSEIEMLRLYLDIEKVRFAERLTVCIDLQEEVADFLIPSLLLQPLVENAIKYAVAASERGGDILIQARRDGDNVLLVVADSGSDDGSSRPGFSANPTAKPAAGTGTGLRNIRERLAALYADQFSLTHANSSFGGYQVEIRIPVGEGSQ